jgi:hypothetical protein
MTEANQSQDDSIIIVDLRLLFWALLKGSWLIILLAGIGAFFGIKHLHNHVLQYEARMVVAPTSQSTAGQKAIGKLGILAGIAGDIGGAARVTLFDRLEQIFRSHKFAKEMEARHQLMGILYGLAWDKEKQAWKEPTGFRHEWREKYSKYLKQPVWQPPDIDSLSNYLAASIRFKGVEGTPFFQITVTKRDPQFAFWLLRSSYEEAERLLRDQDRAQVLLRQQYLEQKVATVQLNDLRSMFLEMLQQEVSRAMLLDSDLPYSAQVIEAAHIPSQPKAPAMNFEIAWRMLLGGILGIFAVLLHFFIRRA